MGEPQNPSIFIPGNCVAGQYGLTAAGPCSNTANVNFRRLLYQADPLKSQAYGGLSPGGDGANASYHGLVLSLQRRLTTNYSLSVNHTWSHCLTENEVALNGGGTGQDPFNRRAEKGNCLADRRHTFGMTAVARTPTFSSPLIQRILGNWQTATIFSAATGTSSTVSVGTDNSRTGGGDRPNLLRDPNLETRTIQRWFDTTAFQTGPVGTFGNAGRGIVEGPGAWNIDMALSRSFPINESQRIDFRAEAFNVLNHTRFDNPSTAMNSATYGQITSARDPRIMQFALKYIF
jgi:hypothetical protein